MTFAATLRAIRKAKGMTQEQLALACGFTGQSRIGNYEADPGKKHAREPELNEIPVIAEALGVNINELFGQEIASAGGSQSARLDAAKVAETVMALRKVFATRGSDFDVAEDPELFVLAYGIREQMSPVPSTEELIDFGMRLADMTPQGGNENERNDGFPARATHRVKAEKRRGR